MNNVRTIGGAGGIFHIFVPGLFLLINIAGTLFCFLPMNDKNGKFNLGDLSENSAIVVALTIAFAYLIGVVLRMLRSERVDRWSAKFLQLTHKDAIVPKAEFDEKTKLPKNKNKYWAYETFPYTGWIGVVSKLLPNSASEFYDNFWGKWNSKNFLNFCKMQIISKDEKAGNEIYALEGLCRYASSTFYALVVASLLMFLVLSVEIFICWRIALAAFILLIMYSLAMVAILHNYRFTRIKEVETIFAAAYGNKDLFQEEQE